MLSNKCHIHFTFSYRFVLVYNSNFLFFLMRNLSFLLSFFLSIYLSFFLLQDEVEYYILALSLRMVCLGEIIPPRTEDTIPLKKLIGGIFTPLTQNRKKISTLCNNWSTLIAFLTSSENISSILWSWLYKAAQTKKIIFPISKTQKQRGLKRLYIRIFAHSYLLHSVWRLSIKPRTSSGTAQLLSISGNNNGLAVGKYSTVGAFYMSYRRANCCTGNSI